VKLVVLLASIGLGFVFWEAPVLRPLKLLVVMMHETGHAMASWAVGGQVQRVTIAADESGACLSALPPGAWRAVIVYSAGYVGSALAGALLLIATFRFGLGRVVLVLLSLWLGVMALFYAGNLFTLVFCLLTAAALGIAARFLPEGAVPLVNIGIASFSALYALLDLRDDLWTSSVRVRSDAQLLADQTFIPALVWAAAWTLLAGALLAGAVAWSVRSGMESKRPAR
jgi:hypothetical protein